MNRNTERKIRQLAAWRREPMARIIAELIADAYLDALVARTPPTSD